MELALHVAQVAEDVGVVEFEVVQHQGARAVVHELGSLVEEGGVVFVGLDHERTAPRRVPDAGTGVEVERNAGDEESGIETGGVENHREHRRGRGLAVRAGDRDHVPALEHLLGQPGGPRGVSQPVVEDVLHARVATRHRVADDHEVRRRLELRRVVSGNRRDSRLVEYAVHWRKHVFVRTGDPIAELTRNQREPGHERAADAENVDVHGPR